MTALHPLYVTASPPTAVSHSCRGAFTSPTASNLIVCKSTLLELHALTANGVELLRTEKLFARIALMVPFRPAGSPTDLLFVCAHDKFRFAILDFARGEVRTLHDGSLEERAGRRLEDKVHCFLDPHSRILGVLLYQGVLKIVPLDKQGRPARSLSGSGTGPPSARAKGKSRLGVSAAEEAPDPFTVRMNELNILSITALHEVTDSFAVLYQDGKGKRHIRSYTVDLAGKELKRGPIPATTVSDAAHYIVAAKPPVGGVLVFDHRAIQHVGPGSNQIASVSVPCKLNRDSVIKACSYIDEDDCRLLVGDLAGNYTLVQVTKGPTGPAVVKPFFLGNTTPCTTLTYLDGGYAYLGSRFGDSALIRLLEEPDSNGSNIELVTTYRNLGPIVDLAVLDASGNDAGMGSQIVTCSGAYSSGSLRVVRHGIEIKPIDVVELPAATRIVTCTAPVIGGSLAAISIGNVQSVLVHVKDDGEVDIVEETGLATDVATIALGQVGDAIAQASHSGIRLFANVDGGATNTLTPLSTANAGSSGNWSAPDMAQIVDVCFADSLALVALARSVCVVSLEAGGVFAPQTESVVHQDADIACIDVDQRQGLAAVCLWNSDVILYSWPAMQVLGKTTLTDYEARSVVIASWPLGTFLLCGRGDGSIVSFPIQPEGEERLGAAHVTPVGMDPVRLSRFQHHGEYGIFASCDHPVVISLRPQSGKLMFSSVNLPGSIDVCSAHIPQEGFNADLILAVTRTGFIIGAMEELENVHVKPVGLNGEMPRRIVHHPQSKSIVIVTERSARHPMLLAGPQREEAFVKLMHDKSFELLDSQALLEGEAPQALCLLPVAGEIDPLVVVGTALVVEGEEEPSEGRILAFRISARQLQLVSATLVRGAVYSIAALTPDDATPDEAAPPHPKAWLAACINNRVHVLEVPRSLSGVPQYQVQASSKMGVSHEKLAPPMRALVSASGFVIALFVEATGCTFAVGDIMKSVTVMRYDPVANTLDVVAKDPAPSWVTSICMLDARHVVATDTEHNLYLTAIPQDANPGGVLGKPRLEMRAEMRMGEFVNRIRLGHLRPAADDALVRPLALSGSVNGQISVLANVGSAHDFATLLELQAALVDSDDLAPPVARFEYGAWRAFSSARKTVEMHGIVDGDLVERFATELQRHEQDQVARVMAEKLKRPVSVDEVMRLVEDIQRLH